MHNVIPPHLSRCDMSLRAWLDGRAQCCAGVPHSSRYDFFVLPRVDSGGLLAKSGRPSRWTNPTVLRRGWRHSQPSSSFRSHQDGHIQRNQGCSEEDSNWCVHGWCCQQIHFATNPCAYSLVLLKGQSPATLVFTSSTAAGLAITITTSPFTNARTHMVSHPVCDCHAVAVALSFPELICANFSAYLQRESTVVWPANAEATP